MKRKLAFFDMDGTLYQTENNVIQPSSLSALQSLKDAGYIIAAATGRPLNNMNEILGQIQFDYYVLINGGYVLDKNFNLITSSPLTQEDVTDIVQLANEKDLGLMFHFGDASYIYNNFYPIYEFSKYTNTLNGVFYDETQSYHRRHNPFNAVLLTKDATIIQDFIDNHPNLKTDLINVKTNGFAYDIFLKSNDKAVGIEAILEKENLGWDDVITFGDSTNDIQMLEKAGYGVAMGSASDLVKSHADYVTTSVYNNGIFNAIKKILTNED